MAKILVVDDVPTQQELTCRALQDAGLSVTRAKDGDEVMDCISRDQPDLILLDIVMERVNGFEALREIRENAATKGIPVIMCSTKSTDFDQEWSQDLGANAYIIKPFEPEQLVNTVRRFL
jgi:CheY-like chemotaxis protein